MRKLPHVHIFWWSLLVGLGIACISFVSNWLMLIHAGESPTTYQLLDISFYFFVPLGSWAILTWIMSKYGRKHMARLRDKWPWLLIAGLVLSPVIRTFDILLDFSIKYLVGMVDASPFAVLSDVWLVVFSSVPGAFVKLVVILTIVYFLTARVRNKQTLMIRTGDGAYHQLGMNTIAYLQSDGNYLNIRAGGADYRTRATLKSLEPQLGPDFYRIHKSSIVNRTHIRQLKHWRNGEYLVVMSDDKPLTSSKSYTRAIREIRNQLAGSTVEKSDPTSATVRPTAG